MDQGKTRSKALLDRALELFQKAYERQLNGELEDAATLYRASIDLFPTAEAHTFLGWTYSFQGQLDEAIAECRKAIAVDPDFGNPYNDIGAYLIELEKLDEAIPWLEQAIQATRYDSIHFPWFNLGRVYVAKELYGQGIECLRQALVIQPDYTPASDAIKAARLKIH